MALSFLYRLVHRVIRGASGPSDERGGQGRGDPRAAPPAGRAPAPVRRPRFTWSDRALVSTLAHLVPRARTVRAECLDRVMVLGARHLERVLFDLRQALQRGAAAPRPRAEAARKFTTPEGPHFRAERDQAPRSPRAGSSTTTTGRLPEPNGWRLRRSAGQRHRRISLRTEERSTLRAGLPSQAFMDGPIIAP